MRRIRKEHAHGEKHAVIVTNHWLKLRTLNQFPHNILEDQLLVFCLRIALPVICTGLNGLNDFQTKLVFCCSCFSTDMPSSILVKILLLKLFQNGRNVLHICDKSLSEGATVVVERGIQTLRDASAERNDRKIEHLRSVGSIKIHTQCRKTYTRKSSISAFKRERDAEASTSTNLSPPRSRKRSNESAFDFKRCCIFCGEEASEEKEIKKHKKFRQKISHVSTLSFKDGVIAAANKRGDDLGKTVTRRIIFEHDLVAAEAKYHAVCYTLFMKRSTEGKVGRPEDTTIILAMEDIFSYIENHDDCQFTLTELKGVCKDFIPDDKTIKSKLLQRYGKRIIITTKSKSSTIISFTDAQFDSLSKA